MEKYAPILLIGYNRPGMLKDSLEYLVSVDARLYVALDIPKPDDVINWELSRQCQEILEEFSAKITNYRISDHNQGCFKGVTRAISWAFTHEDQLIILEDDIRVDEIFLRFASQMLDSYEFDNRIGSIAGTNLVPTDAISDAHSAYRLSAFTSSWGWCTWKDRWQQYERDLNVFPTSNYDFPMAFWNRTKRHYWKKTFSSVASGDIDSWAYRWLYSNWENNHLTITPNENLVLNVGFGPHATHTRDLIRPWWLPESISSSFEFNSAPFEFCRDAQADKWMEANHFRTRVSQQIRRELILRFPRLGILYLSIRNRLIALNRKHRP